MSMQLTSNPANVVTEQEAIAPDWSPVCHITYNRDSWVKLNQAPSAYSQEEALLLCEEKSGTWVSWVPGYGEVTLNKSEFYC
ncbi:hypothetical protein IQ215_12830 [Cyanobacterium stanieri LEGE 03274]|uniref:Uncharacterized protein n=1 Tax=Cyanobacterium stanieri LEGE 03274 TaxID=1828756 RepID=A0ABR9V6R7_9CHRO|nr:hypothetical protein [Cyanobacterium stanieri]MBE9223582.1 hypothetical protein [Cyanobacterium stanieri LEGE 03274]